MSQRGNNISYLLSSLLAPAQNVLIDNLSNADANNLVHTVRGANDDLRNTILGTRFDINRRLAKLFRDPIAFRSLQAQCNALISDQIVVGFFSRDQLGDSSTTMILWVETIHTPLFAAFFAGEGYLSLPSGSSPTFYHKFIDGRNQAIWLNHSEKPPIFELFSDARHTGVLNFASWNRAYSLFPAATFLERDVYLLDRLNHDTRNALRAATQDGFKTKSIRWNQRGEGLHGDSVMMTRHRRVGDYKTWMIDLNTDDITPSHVPDGVLESTTFQLHGPIPGRHGKPPRYNLDFALHFMHPVLRYQYVTRSVNGSNNTRQSLYCLKLCDLHQRLNDATKIEMAKIPRARRPPEYRQLMNGTVNANELRGAFPLPATWTFYDDDVIRFMADASEIERQGELESFRS